MGAGMAMGQQMANSMNINNTSTPPPLPNQIAQYFIAIDGKQEGPYSLEVIEKELLTGKISNDTLLWTQGMNGWTKASTILTSSFAQTPPPLT